MANKEYSPYRLDLFNNTNLDVDSISETVHLKGTRVEYNDTDAHDQNFGKQELYIVKKHDADSIRNESHSEDNIASSNGSNSDNNEPDSLQENTTSKVIIKQEYYQLEEQYDMDLIHEVKKIYEGAKRNLMRDPDEEPKTEVAGDLHNETFSSEAKRNNPKGKDSTYSTDDLRRDDFERKQKERAEKERLDIERKQKERAEKERLDFERKQKERAEKERREFERQEKERKEIERREFERQEREREERERQEKGLQKNKDFERNVLTYSEKIPSLPEDCGFALYTEKKVGLGEDSVPLIYRSANTICVGVFDGMGGAGAAEYPTLTIGNKTGAYLSSRVVRAVCLNWLLNNGNIDKIRLKEDISKCFNYLLSIWNVKPSGLRSGFVRILPTTMAIVEASRRGNNTEVTSYWAGDSRNYALLASGLKQLSCDDLRQPKDPLENLRSDDALSNCICQDKPFEINVKIFSFNEPVIILSATDGCFGYLLTPMHFEYILLESMMKSSNCNEWSEAIRQSLSPISSDDFTIGLQIVDGDFVYWKNLLHVRYEYLRDSVIMPIEQMKAAHDRALHECAISEQNLYNGITDLWHQYKEEFMLTNQSYRNDN